LAVEAINRHCGINGRPLKLIIKDDKNTEERILKADKSRIEAGCPVIIGHNNSQNTFIAYPLVTSHKRILFTAYSATTRLSGKDDLFFRTSVDNYLFGKAFGRLLKDEGIGSIVFLLDESNPTFSEDLREEISKNFDGRISTVRINSSTGIDWDRTAERLMATRAEAVVMVTEGIATGIAAQKLKLKGYNGRYFATLWAHDPILIAYGSQAVEGMEIVTFLKPEYDNSMYREFSYGIVREFSLSHSPKAARAYEAIFILADAMKRCVPNPEDVLCIKRHLLSESYNFLLGPVRFDKFGDVLRPIYDVQVRNQKFVLKRRLL